MSELWILDIDTTVKPLYGHQEGAVVSYNPHKPGRPSHSYHCYMMANLRLVLAVDVAPGNEHTSKHCSPRLWKFLDGLAPAGEDLVALPQPGPHTGGVGPIQGRDQLMDAAYGETIYVDDRTIDSHIKRVRRKFREVDGEFEQIETLYGIGYRYRDS